MSVFVGVTNNDWFAFLSQQPEVSLKVWRFQGKQLVYLTLLDAWRQKRLTIITSALWSEVD